MENNALKTIAKTDDELRVGNYILLFGGRDLEWVRSGKNPDGSMGEFFTPETNIESSYTKAGIFHVDWEHGEGKAIDGKAAPGPDDVLGYVDWKTARKDDKGWFVERVMNRRIEYVKWLEELVDAGLVGTSSEAVTEKVKVGKNGEIKTWPLKRDTLTVSPAEPRMMTENIVTAIKSLAEIYPDLTGLLQGEEITDAAETISKSRLMQLKAKAYLFLEE